MKANKLHMKMRKLTASEKHELKMRESRYRAKLAQQGYTTHVLVDDSGTFGIVLVIDSKLDRKGLLLPNGKVRWIDGAMAPGALADAVISGVKIEGPH